MPDPRIIIEVREGAPSPGGPSQPKDAERKGPDGQQPNPARDTADNLEKHAKDVGNEVKKAAKTTGEGEASAMGRGIASDASGAAGNVGKAGAGIAEGAGGAEAAGAGIAEGAGAAGAMAAAGPVGIVIGALVLVAIAAKAAVDAMNKLADEFMKRGQELAIYSGQISGAQAMAGVRSMQMDIQETRAVEEQTSRMIEAQSKTDAIIRDAMMPLKEGLAGLAASWEEWKVSFFETIAPILKFIAERLKELLSIPSAMMKFSKGMYDALKDLLGITSSINEKIKDSDVLPSQAWIIYDQIDSMVRGYQAAGGVISRELELEMMRRDLARALQNAR